jgi:hypothetical protein
MKVARRASWWLPIPYFDGTCEAFARWRKSTGKRACCEARCGHPATSVRDGHAVCALHRVGDLDGMVPEAAIFRFEGSSEAARVRARWEF